MARLLQEKLGIDHISLVSLADYISMEDEVRFDDITTAMEVAWHDRGLPQRPGSVNAIVHSTGALVIRDWLQRNYGPESAPIKNLVMLAPANFGSPLAHKGRSFIARVYKGFIAKRPEGRPFETGTHILKGLELASPYTWDLASRDRFGPGGKMYGPGNVLCTVLVGNTGYRGISSIANEKGSDGTVRVSTANMDCARIEASFPANPNVVGHDVEYSIEESSGLTAFGVMDGLDHGKITLSHRRDEKETERDARLFDHIVQALTVTDDEFAAWRQQLAKNNDKLLPTQVTGGGEKHGFQNTIVRVQDQYEVGVPDYLLEFYEKDDDRGRIAELFHATAIENVHKYSGDQSYRSFYFDCTRLGATIDKIGEFLSMSLTAFPELGKRSPVGFTTFAYDGIGGVRIAKDEIGKFFVPHRTVLITLRLERQQSDRTFRLSSLKDGDR